MHGQGPLEGPETEDALAAAGPAGRAKATGNQSSRRRLQIFPRRANHPYCTVSISPCRQHARELCPQIVVVPANCAPAVCGQESWQLLRSRIRQNAGFPRVSRILADAATCQKPRRHTAGPRTFLRGRFWLPYVGKAFHLGRWFGVEISAGAIGHVKNRW